MRRVQQYGGAAENAKALLIPGATPGERMMVAVPIRGVIDDEPDRGCDVEVVIGISDEEPLILVVDELIIRRRPGGPPLTTTAVRRAGKIPELLDEAVAGLAMPITSDETGRWSARVTSEEWDVMRTPPNQATRARRRSGGPVRVVDDADVETIVRRAIDAGRSDYRKAVVDELGVGASTAARAMRRVFPDGVPTKGDTK
jgi:hypothetical protein